MRLIPNLVYTMTVQPSPDSAYASQVVEGVTPTMTDPWPVTLSGKIPVSGTLYGADGKPVANAVVQAVGTAESASVGVAVGPTDSDGRFRLLVDGGTYDLEVAPPDGSLYPRWALEGVAVGNSEAATDIHLPPAIRIAGRVRGPDGRAVAGVDVRAYLRSQAGFGRLRGQALSMADGSFSLLLASPP